MNAAADKNDRDSMDDNDITKQLRLVNDTDVTTMMKMLRKYFSREHDDLTEQAELLVLHSSSSSSSFILTQGDMHVYRQCNILVCSVYCSVLCVLLPWRRREITIIR